MECSLIENHLLKKTTFLSDSYEERIKWDIGLAFLTLDKFLLILNVSLRITLKTDLVLIARESP